jgi:protein-tyrosine kinase
MEQIMNFPAPAATPASTPPRSGDSIGALLLAARKITPENADQVLRMQKETGMRFGEAAQRLGLVTDADIAQVLARQFDYSYLEPGKGPFPEELVAAYQPFSPQVETLRAVRSQLLLKYFAGHRKSLVVLGVSSGDGASLFAANLAVVFSQLGQRTLLVDANLRKPRQHEIFALKGRQGLSDVLAGRSGLDVVSKIEEFVDLSVLGAGTLPPNPQELLSRGTFGALNAQLESQYDVVLYDVPSVELGSDALMAAARSGGALLVVRRDKTALADVALLREQVERSGADVVGAVMVDF